MSVRFCSLRAFAAPGVLAATALLALWAPRAQALGGSLISIGRSPSAAVALPSIRVEVPAPGAGAPLAEVGVSEKGVTASTPVLAPLEVPVAKPELPSPPAVPVVPPTPTLPARPPPVEAVTNPIVSAGSGGSGSSTGASAAGSGHSSVAGNVAGAGAPRT
ncbi:MAG: hypothetical protein QOK19_2228, partial [Solirubrobacteraceae bacterium]|nr:hypothetical protein [Solirubrobacteraceae bacterium]